MTYLSGQPITASDFNTLFANKVNSTWSTGSGAAGWGQSAVNVVSGGAIITAAQWNDYITKANLAYRHINNGAAAPITGSASAGSVISIIGNMETTANNVNANALSGLTGVAGPSLSRNTGSGFQQTSVSASATYTFASYDQMRWFFNANGQVYFNAVYTPAATNAKNTDWSSIVGNLGTTYVTRNNFYSIGAGLTFVTSSSVNGTYGAGNFARFSGVVSGSSLIITIYAQDTGEGTLFDSADTLGFITAYFYSTYPATTYLSSAWGTISLA